MYIYSITYYVIYKYPYPLSLKRLFIYRQYYIIQYTNYMGFPGGSDDKESTCNCGRPSFDPWIGKFPWRREQLLTPVFWPGEFHGQRSLVGYSPWGHKESDTTEQLSLHVTSTYYIVLYNYLI